MKERKTRVISERHYNRFMRAEKVCQELRYAVANNDGLFTSVDFLVSWMRVAPKKVKYGRAKKP